MASWFLLGLIVSLALNLFLWRRALYSERQLGLMHESYNGLIAHADSSIKQLQEALIALEHDRGACAKRADEYFASIESAIAQRNEWQQLYYQHAIEHGNAQAALLAELLRFRSIAHAKGIELNLTPGLAALVADYYDVHAEPSAQAAPEHKLAPRPEAK